MLFKGIMTQASGSLGGITASHNRGGMYFRARAIPTDPNSAQQQVLRGAMSSLAVVWADVLTQAQRDAWDVYADNVPVVNALGDSIKLSGMNHFVRSNTPLLQAGEDRVDTAPTTYNIGEFTAVGLSVSEATQLASVTFDNNDDWAKVAGGFLFVFLSRPQNATVNYFRGPYRLAGTIDGAATPPTSPATFAVPFAVTEGQKLFGRFTAAIGDGRYTAAQFLPATVAA